MKCRHKICCGKTWALRRYGDAQRESSEKRHPEVTLNLLLPYHPYDRPIQTPPSFDGIYYRPGMATVPKRAAIVQANRYMVDQINYLIAYAWYPASNAGDL